MVSLTGTSLHSLQRIYRTGFVDMLWASSKAVTVDCFFLLTGYTFLFLILFFSWKLAVLEDNVL